MAGSAVVVHSLGNFVFDMDFQTKTREGIFLEIVLWDGAVKAVEPVPYVIDDIHSTARAGRSGEGHPRRRVGQQPRTVCAVSMRVLRLVQRQQPRPYRPANPIELAPVDDARYVAPGVVARVGNAAEPDGGNA